MKDQLKETIKEMNRLEKQNQRFRTANAELKNKIEKIRRRQSNNPKDESPIDYSHRQMQVSNLAGAQENPDIDDEDPSFCQIQELPSLRCSIIDGPGGPTKSSDIHQNVDWNELLVRESIPDDYGTIRASETNRAQNEKLRQQDGNMIMQNFN